MPVLTVLGIAIAILLALDLVALNGGVDTRSDFGEARQVRHTPSWF